MGERSFIRDFLLSPRFRTRRYLSLAVFFIIVSLNQAIVGYKDIMPAMGNKIYWAVLADIACYMITVFVVLKIILNYLLSGKYLKFVLCIIGCAILFTLIPNIVFFLYSDHYDPLSKFVIIDNISAFVIFVLCISGVIIPVFLKNKLASQQRVNQLKIKQKSSQIEQLKEQINPTSFFKILNKSGTLVKDEPEKASAMLMKLGQLLRYQLYDCNRAQVLLTAEISFLRNFLELEKLYSTEFDYSIHTVDNINGVFVPSSILLPYVQSVINALDIEKRSRRIDIRVTDLDDTVHVILTISDIQSFSALQEELSKIKERFNTLYKSHYELNITNDDHEYPEVSLKLDKK